MMKKVLCGSLLCGLLAAGANAQVWAEVGDAGSSLATAQHTVGSGALTNITGATSGDADIYCISITDPSLFSALALGGDTQLFLFDLAGFGLLANDDGGTGLDAAFPVGSAASLAAGNYYLAISNFDHDPVSAGGLIFPSSPFAPVYGPTGPGGGSALSGWSGGSGGGSYDIVLRGASYCAIPAPGAALLGMIGMTMVGWLRRRVA